MLKRHTKRILLTVTVVVVLFALALGAIMLGYITGWWVYAETSDPTLARFVGYGIYGAFAVSLGVVIGVGNYLRGLRLEKRSERQLQASAYKLWRGVREDGQAAD